ncbi:methyl-accepting chemotaxis protein [Maricurvus nonylphenolicus]|uniref:methyl-accepting chemotaxis protein n=1 Tax=Maricurvus nonylphenolicus TaxID=1008307 RepID=UPI0036F2B1A1
MPFRSLVSRYLTTLVVIPACLLILVCAWLLISSLASVTRLSTAVDLLYLSDLNGNLVHELQKERGMSAGYLGSGGTKFADSLVQQRKLTDRRYKEYYDFVHSSAGDDFSPRIREQVTDLVSSMESISSVRSGVDNLSMNLKAVLSYYTSKNIALIEQPLLLIRYVDDKYLVEDLIATYNLMEVKEKAGLERAVLSNMLASKTFTSDVQRRLYSLIAEQKAYEDSFVKSASPGLLDFYNAFANGNANRDVLQLRLSALDAANQGEYKIAPEIWFDASTQRINALKTLEEQVIKHMHEIVEGNYSQGWYNMVLLGVLMSFVLFNSVLVVTNLSLSRRQAERLRSTLETVTKQQDLTQRVDVLSQDQMGRIALLANRLLDRMQSDMEKISTNTLDSVASTQDTIVAIVQSEENIRNQLAQTSSTAGAVEELACSIREVSINIDSTATSVSTAMQECHDGQLRVKEASESIQIVATEISNLSESIVNLDQRVETISSVIEVIESVAEQTNLLALNAAIEAARAGDQGRGFAVVADEVRQLAKRVQSSTEEIGSIIGALQSDSKNSMGVIKEVRKRSESAVEKSAGINDSLMRIVSSMQDVNEKAMGISESGRQQASVTDEMTRVIADIDKMSQENLDGAEEICQSASLLSEMSMGLMDLIDMYKVSEQPRYIEPTLLKKIKATGSVHVDGEVTESDSRQDYVPQLHLAAQSSA